MKKILIHGAGSTGCFIGGALCDRKADVTFLGRPRIIEALSSHGMTLSDYQGWSTHIAPSQFAASTSPEILRDADLIVLTVKNTALLHAANEIAEFANPETPVLSMQNGVSHIDTLKTFLPNRQILRGIVPYNVAQLSNHHWHKGTSGALLVEQSQHTEELHAIMQGHAGAFALKSDMLSVAWGKLLLNLNNPLNALSGVSLREELSQHPFRQILAASIREALGVLRAASIKPVKVGAMPPNLLPVFLNSPDWFFKSIGLRLQKIDAEARSSMADDFAAVDFGKGRVTEIDFINGEILRLAETLKVQAPLNHALVELVKAAEQGGQKKFSGQELQQAVSAR